MLIEDDTLLPTFSPGDMLFVDTSGRLTRPTGGGCRVVALLRDGRLCTGVAVDCEVWAGGEVGEPLAAWLVTTIACAGGN